MSRKIAGSLIMGSLSLGLVGTGLALAQGQDAQPTPSTTAHANDTNQNESRKMVRGVVSLTRSLDAKKAQPGSTFEARLESDIHLKNGTDLPKGSMLVGQVATDDMGQSGNSKLALRFLEAKIKGSSSIPNRAKVKGSSSIPSRAKIKGSDSIPIRATIVEVYPPSGFTGYGSGATAGGTPLSDPDDASFASQTLKVDQVGAIDGVDLHSNVTSRNSGVFVTTKKDDVKLAQGSQLALAISALEQSGRQ